MSKAPVRHPHGGVGRQLDTQVQSTESGPEGSQKCRVKVRRWRVCHMPDEHPRVQVRRLSLGNPAMNRYLALTLPPLELNSSSVKWGHGTNSTVQALLLPL